METNNPTLDLATLDDMLCELERRGVMFLFCSIANEGRPVEESILSTSVTIPQAHWLARHAVKFLAAVESH